MTDATQAGGAPVQEAGLADAGAAWLSAIRAQAGQLLGLATLELRYSGKMLASALGLALAIGLALFSTWALLVAAAVGGIMAAGLAWPWALLSVAGLMLASALAMAWFVRRCISRVGMDATRSALGLGAANDD